MTWLLAGLPDGMGLVWLLGGALVSGLARGFSGFGAAMIFVPIAAIAVGPQRAAPLMLLVDMLGIVAITPGAWASGDRREVGWLAIGLGLGMPIGVAALLSFDPLPLRWAISLSILAMLALLVSGWRFAAEPPRRVTIGVGILGGVLGGVAMIPGPPGLAYLLSRQSAARRIRDDFALYLAASAVFATIAYIAGGLLGWDLLRPTLAAAPLYGFGIWMGTRMFGLASDLTFRRVCYGMIALAALIGLPLWDGMRR